MSTQSFKQVIVYCTDRNTSARADVLQQSDNLLKVAFVGSSVTMVLNRNDVRKPYVGNHLGMEFTSTAKEV